MLGEWHNYECHISAIFPYPSGLHSPEHEAGLSITVSLRSVKQKSVRLIYLNISAVDYTCQSIFNPESAEDLPVRFTFILCPLSSIETKTPLALCLVIFTHLISEQCISFYTVGTSIFSRSNRNLLPIKRS
jgi:hypothetical protein